MGREYAKGTKARREEISDPSNLRDDRDIVRLYQVWLRTGSQHAAKMLERAGINVINPSNRTQH